MVFEELNGKVAIVTGSSSGIGAATAAMFAKYGTSVTITGRNTDALLKTKSDCEASGLKPDQILSIIGDVRDDKHLENLVSQTIEKFGRLDYLINNAGTSKMGTIIDSPMDNYQFIFDVNVRSIVKLTQLAADHLEKTKGSIVNISSLAGRRPYPRMGYYCMSKAAVDMMTKCLALELAPKGVRVNVINPGLIDTNIFVSQMGMPAEMKDEFFKLVASKSPIPRPGSPDEIANCIIFLVSNMASYITATNLVIDGGLEELPSISE